MEALAVSFGINAVQGLLGGLQKRAAQKAENKAIKANNRRQLVEMSYAIGQGRVQEAALRAQAAQDLHTAGRMASSAKGNARAQAAAAGVKGASVQAVQNDIDMELSRVVGEVGTNLITQQYNLNEQARSIAVSTLNNFGQLNKVASPLALAGQAAIGGALSTGSIYAEGLFKFGV